MSKTNEKKLSAKSDIDTSDINTVVAMSAVLCVLAAVLFDKTNEFHGFGFVIFGLTIVVAAAIFLAAVKKLTVRNVILLIFAAGFVIRLNYVLYTSLTISSTLRQHDLLKFGGGKGHTGYIEYFYNNGLSLPNFDPQKKFQFYHPPLHHFISGLWMRLLTNLGMSYERAVSCLQFPTLFYSMCFLAVFERTLNKLNLKGLSKIIPFAIVAFHPTFIIFSGSVNNDNLSTLFIMIAFYAAISWEKEPTMKNIMLIAFSVGLGMSTKLSVILITPAIAIIFLYKLIFDKENFVRYMRQFVAFAFVCLPLGLWFYVRNAVKFHTSMTYVPRLVKSADQYIGYHTVYERLFDYTYHPFKNVFLNRVVNGEGEYFEYNPFVAIIKSSLFGEYKFTDQFANITPFCRILIVLNIILIVISLAAMIYCVICKNDYINRTLKIFIIFYYIFMMAAYIRFVFKFPHTCSMDYRYIPMTCIIGATFIGILLEQLNKINYIKYTVVGATVLFCTFSSLIYILIGI